jgi:hypothetical protein
MEFAYSPGLNFLRTMSMASQMALTLRGAMRRRRRAAAFPAGCALDIGGLEDFLPAVREAPRFEHETTTDL